MPRKRRQPPSLVIADPDCAAPDRHRGALARMPGRSGALPPPRFYRARNASIRKVPRYSDVHEPDSAMDSVRPEGIQANPSNGRRLSVELGERLVYEIAAG